jgi:NAD(P)-dependent dehydrogenase (short-subunit alcohol dehydrogenase family)
MAAPTGDAAALLRLEGRVALITGAAGGVGAATAALFDRLGARLALCDREPLDGWDERAVCAQMDVRDADAADELVARTVEAHNRIDVLVNNAGGTFGSPFTDVSAKGEAALIAENFTQVTHFIRAVVPHMPDGGSIINVTSIEAHRAGPGYAVYSAMKAELDSLTKTLALELAPKGIRVNAVAPDAVTVGGLEAAGEQLARTNIPYHPSPAPPIGRWGVPDDVARVIAFLAGELAGYVTGVSLLVDGGNHAAGGWHRTDVSH